MQLDLPITSLTNDQKAAAKFLDKFIANTAVKEALLIGPAGTGKTWLLGVWLEKLMIDNPQLKDRVCIAAPTHAALDVLRQKCGHIPVPFRTLNSLLGVSVRRTDEGAMLAETFKSDCEYLLVAVDEGSMVNEEFKFLMDQKVRKGEIAKVLYLADRAQLKPVKEETSKVFNIPKEHTVELNEIVRYGGAIIRLATYLRKCFEDEQDFNLFTMQEQTDPKDRSVSYIKKAAMYEWALHAEKAGLSCRILAWTNLAVFMHNEYMHQTLYPDAPFFGVGEKALVNDTYQLKIKKEGEPTSENDSLYNGEVLTVTSCTLADKLHGLTTYEVSANRTTGLPVTVRVAIDDGHRLRVHKQLNEDIYAIKGMTVEKSRLIAIRKEVNRLAPLRHAYSNTVHKAQGRTYDVAIVDFRDIVRSEEKTHLMYVGSTRPSKFLVFVH